MTWTVLETTVGGPATGTRVGVGEAAELTAAGVVGLTAPATGTKTTACATPSARAETTATVPHSAWCRRARGASTSDASTGRVVDLRARWWPVWWTLGPDTGQAIAHPQMLLNSAAPQPSLAIRVFNKTLASKATETVCTKLVVSAERIRENPLLLTSKHPRPVRGARASKLRTPPFMCKVMQNCLVHRCFACLGESRWPLFWG